MKAGGEKYKTTWQRMGTAGEFVARAGDIAVVVRQQSEIILSIRCKKTPCPVARRATERAGRVIPWTNSESRYDPRESYGLHTDHVHADDWGNTSILGLMRPEPVPTKSIGSGLMWTCIGSVDCWRLRTTCGKESSATNKPGRRTGVSPRSYPAG
jgi:hypothetical protein